MCSAMWEESQKSNMKIKSFPKTLLQDFTLLSLEIFDFLLQITNRKPDGFIFFFSQLKIIVPCVISGEKPPAKLRKLKEFLDWPLFQYFFPS